MPGYVLLQLFEEQERRIDPLESQLPPTELDRFKCELRRQVSEGFEVDSLKAKLPSEDPCEKLHASNKG